MEEAVYNKYKIDLGPTGTYSADCYGAIGMMKDMNKMVSSSTNKKVGFLINAGKNEDHAPVITMNSEHVASVNLAWLGFAVHSVSITEDVNEKLEVILKKNKGKSFNFTMMDSILRKYGFDKESFNMIDSDEDGLFDTFEINGMRIQNGTVVYTDPYLADTDGDGRNDFHELGGLPNELILNDYITLINYRISDPNDRKSTENFLMDGYMEIESLDYLPYDKDNYDRIFINDTGDVDAEGNKIYGRYNIYNSNPDELSNIEVAIIISKVFMQEAIILQYSNKNGISIDTILPNARSNLLIYILDIGDKIVFDGGEVLKESELARDIWAESVFHLMMAAEGYLSINQSAILAETPNNQTRGIEFVVNKKKFSMNDVDNYLAIHSSKARIVADVYFDGHQYCMDMKFYIFDYYDWDKNDDYEVGLASPKELYELCRCGRARFYEHWGVYETQIVWEATETGRQLALTMAKENMVKE